MDVVKDGNPKDFVAETKIPINLFPYAAILEGSLAMYHGALKYGRANWRPAGARASVYINALLRHTFAFDSGEDIDEESGLPHTAHMLACVAIIVEARASGNLVDDRQYPIPYRKLVDDLTPHVVRLKVKFADRNPKHYTIADAPMPAQEK